MFFSVPPRFLGTFFHIISSIISLIEANVFLIDAVNLIFLLFPNALTIEDSLGRFSTAFYSAISKTS